MRKLGTKQEAWAVVFLWACFSTIALMTIYEQPIDSGGLLRLPLAAGLGLLGLLPFVLFGIGQCALDRLRRMIAYHRLSPVERLAFRMNSRTEPGWPKRKALEKRLVTIAISAPLRETVYHDPKSDQFWLSVYWEQDFHNGEDLKPLDQRQKDQALRRFQAADERS